MEFDDYASEYDAALERGLSVAGESKDYFARWRVSWLSGNLRALQERPQRILDYGCGTGSAVPHLIDSFSTASIVGVDLSARSLEVARRVSAQATFLTCDEYVPQGAIDLAFCNGVFHHIRPPDRPSAIDYVYRSLRPGGLFALWENNPWNPGTRYVMSRIPFDRDAITLSPLYARRMLKRANFKLLRTDFRFYFPRMLKWLRPLELLAIKIPLGSHYL